MGPVGGACAGATQIIGISSPKIRRRSLFVLYPFLIPHTLRAPWVPWGPRRVKSKVKIVVFFIEGTPSKIKF